MESATPSSRAWTLIIRCKSSLIVLPYLVGCVWALLHPISSILTGHLTRPRGWYIDENSLETNNLRSDYRYLSTPSPSTSDCEEDMASLCDVVDATFLLGDNVQCHSHMDMFDLVRLVPVANTVEPSQEAVVLVVPHPGENQSWTTSPFHRAMGELMRRLASAQAVPWLAKTIYLVSPTSHETSLETVVHVFLEATLGTHEETIIPSSSSTRIEPLPLNMSDAMIRNLLVLDMVQQETTLAKNTSNQQQQPQPQATNDEIRILAQGKRGVLPNMDLVFTATSVFQRAPIHNGNIPRNRRSVDDTKTPTVLLHPYNSHRHWETYWVKQVLVERYSLPGLEPWAIRLGHLVLFCRHLFQGPPAPHALALERGIDAITIRGTYPVDSSETTPQVTALVANFVQKVEITLHGLSNLHERLHHSTPLYLLPSPLSFVKHEEYLVPNLLLLIPLVLRAAFLGLVDIARFDFAVIGWLLTITMTATLVMDVLVADQQDTELRNALWILLYVTAAAVWYDKVLRRKLNNNNMPEDYVNAMGSAQLILSLLTIYVHVPICFQNVSLSYPSAAFWAPVVAFVPFAKWYPSNLGAIISATWLVLSWPPTALLPTIFDNSCTVYVRYLYFPLHLSLFLTFVLGILLRPRRK